MKRLFLLQATAAAILLFGLVVVVVRLTQLAGPALWWDVAGRPHSPPPAELTPVLRNPHRPLDATLFVRHRPPTPPHPPPAAAPARAPPQARPAPTALSLASLTASDFGKPEP